MTEKLSPYQGLMATIKKAAGEKGAGGCFMEIYREAKSLAGIADSVGDDGTIKHLSTLVRSLPPMQNSESVGIAQHNLDLIRENLSIFPQEERV